MAAQCHFEQTDGEFEYFYFITLTTSEDTVEFTNKSIKNVRRTPADALLSIAWCTCGVRIGVDFYRTCEHLRYLAKLSCMFLLKSVGRETCFERIN